LSHFIHFLLLVEFLPVVLLLILRSCPRIGVVYRQFLEQQQVLQLFILLVSVHQLIRLLLTIHQIFPQAWPHHQQQELDQHFVLHLLYFFIHYFLIDLEPIQ